MLVLDDDHKRRGAKIVLRMVSAAAFGFVLSSCNPVRDVAVATGFGAKAPEPAPFVKESRGGVEGAYMPVGVKAPPRTLKARTKEEAEALQAQLDAQRQATEAAGASAQALGAAVKARPIPKPPQVQNNTTSD
ncbi:hypothetical protein ACFQU1_23055 [Chelatococcus sp. GCM10030263]|uniref:hypothetical protein n=1 Tax=Chelatococcus sp. GCM10030263 TaxID=3273387 RepID=UPI00360F1ED3